MNIKEIIKFLTRSKWSVVVGSIAACVLFAMTVIEFAKKHISHDLLIVSNESVKPLDGYAVKYDENNKPVYMDGVQLSFDMVHNHDQAHTIVVREIRLNVIDYDKRIIHQFGGAVDAEEILGKGTVVPNIFRTKLTEGKSIETFWGGSMNMKKSISFNLLETEPPFFLTISDSEKDIEPVKGYIRVSGAGLYKLSVTINYSINGKNYSHESAAFKIYTVTKG